MNIIKYCIKKILTGDKFDLSTEDTLYPFHFEFESTTQSCHLQMEQLDKNLIKQDAIQKSHFMVDLIIEKLLDILIKTKCTVLYVLDENPIVKANSAYSMFTKTFVLHLKLSFCLYLDKSYTDKYELYEDYKEKQIKEQKS